MSAETVNATPAQAEEKTPPKGLGAMAGAMFLVATSATVSYTHLTLPTILLV